MSATVWRCRNAELHFTGDGYTSKYAKPSGYDNGEYNCKVKEFFSSLMPPQVGCWENDCQNRECSKYLKCRDKCKDNDADISWCNHGLVYLSDRDAFKKCSCSGVAEDCPFFKPRDKASWIDAARHGLVPLLKKDGKLRSEAKSAILKYDISHKMVVKLIQEELEMRKNLEEYFKKREEAANEEEV